LRPEEQARSPLIQNTPSPCQPPPQTIFSPCNIKKQMAVGRPAQLHSHVFWQQNYTLRVQLMTSNGTARCVEFVVAERRGALSW
jgi:hypothetical protein